MTIKHDAAIRNLFAALKEKTQEQEHASLYESLAFLVEDLKVFFKDNASNAPYMKGKAELFLGACKVIAGIDEPPNSLTDSISCADGNLLKIRSFAQWK